MKETQFKRPFGAWGVRKYTGQNVSYVGSGYGTTGMTKWEFYIMRYYAATKDRAHPRNYYFYIQKVTVGRRKGTTFYPVRNKIVVEVWRTTSIRAEPTFICETSHRTKRAAMERLKRLEKSLMHHYKTSNRAEWKPPK